MIFNTLCNNFYSFAPIGRGVTMAYSRGDCPGLSSCWAFSPLLGNFLYLYVRDTESFRKFTKNIVDKLIMGDKNFSPPHKIFFLLSFLLRFPSAKSLIARRFFSFLCLLHRDTECEETKNKKNGFHTSNAYDTQIAELGLT